MTKAQLNATRVAAIVALTSAWLIIALSNALDASAMGPVGLALQTVGPWMLLAMWFLGAVLTGLYIWRGDDVQGARKVAWMIGVLFVPVLGPTVYWCTCALRGGERGAR